MTESPDMQKVTEEIKKMNYEIMQQRR
jgi:hypothetical protein